MDFKQLSIFLEIIRQGTFTEAAKTLYLSQPTVSLQIAALEKELGVRLFERQGRACVLTPAGRILMKYATDIMMMREKARRAMDQYRGDISGCVDVWASNVPADYVLPGLLARFLELYPKVFVNLSRSHSRGVWQRVLAYETELGIVGTLGEDPEIEYVPLMQDHLVIVAPPEGKYREWPESISFRSLLEEPLVLREIGSGTQKTFDDALRKKGVDVQELNIRARLQSTEAVKLAVAAGLGVGIISELAAAREIAAGTLLRFTLIDLDLERSFYIITHKRKVLSPPVEMLKRFIIARSKEVSGR